MIDEMPPVRSIGASPDKTRLQVMRRLGAVCPGVAVLAGAGTFVGRAAAEATGLTPCDLADDVGTAAARSAPAAAVAYLLSEFVLTEGA